MTAVKSLLGVRVTTPNLTCLLEAGIPSLQALVREKQARFFNKIQQRNGLLDDPLWFVLQLLKKENQVMYSHISEIMEKQDHIESDRRDLIYKLLSKDGTRYKTYQAINPDLAVHPHYTSTSCTPYIEDYLRIAFTRFRLSSHRLRVEMGRWSRIPPEQRTCQCETGIQNEQHILVCPLTQDIRDKYGFGCNDLSSLFVGSNRETLCMLYACLSRLEQQRTQ